MVLHENQSMLSQITSHHKKGLPAVTRTMWVTTDSSNYSTYLLRRMYDTDWSNPHQLSEIILNLAQYTVLLKQSIYICINIQMGSMARNPTSRKGKFIT